MLYHLSREKRDFHRIEISSCKGCRDRSNGISNKSLHSSCYCFNVISFCGIDHIKTLSTAFEFPIRESEKPVKYVIFRVNTWDIFSNSKKEHHNSMVMWI